MTKSLTIEEFDPKDAIDWTTLVEDLVPIALDDKIFDQVVYVGFLLDAGHRGKLIQFLKKNQDVFVWSHEDMSSIDPQITSHRLSMNLNFYLIKQKRRAMAQKRQRAAS